LITALARDLRCGADVTVVLEGAARVGVEPGILDGIQVVHAPGSADDEIVRIVAAAAAGKDRSITVVTADRQLRERVTALGARVIGPGSLWEHLDAGS
jgi:rRNA-processing protein FCF1